MEEVSCEAIRTEGFRLGHLAYRSIYLLHGDRFIENLIVLPCYCPMDECGDLGNVLFHVIVVLSHYPFEVVGKLFLNLSPSIHLGPIFSFDSIDLRA